MKFNNETLENNTLFVVSFQSCADPAFGKNVYPTFDCYHGDLGLFVIEAREVSRINKLFLSRKVNFLSWDLCLC